MSFGWRAALGCLVLIVCIDNRQVILAHSMVNLLYLTAPHCSLRSTPFALLSESGANLS